MKKYPDSEGWKRLKKFYKKNNIADVISKMDVNISKYKRGLANPNKEQELDRIYKKYALTRFPNEIKFYDENIDKYNEREVNRRWNQYLHREALMISGQYEEYRDSLFKKRYLEILQRTDVSQEIIDKLKSLSNEDWLNLIKLPQSDTTSNKVYSLPVVQDYYNVIGVVNKAEAIEELENDIKAAWKEAFETDIIEENDDLLTDDEHPYNEYFKVYTPEDGYEYKQNFFYNDEYRVFRKMPKRYRSDVQFNKGGRLFKIDNETYQINTKEARYAVIAHMEKRGTAKLRTTKRGTQYYPFFLNRQETADYLAWKRNHEK